MGTSGHYNSLKSFFQRKFGRRGSKVTSGQNNQLPPTGKSGNALDLTLSNPSAVNLTQVLRNSPRNANGNFTARSGQFNNGSLTLRTGGSGGKM